MRAAVRLKREQTAVNEKDLDKVHSRKGMKLFKLTGSFFD